MVVLSLHLKPSRYLTLILTAAHFFSGCIVILLALPLIVKLLISVVLAVSLYYYLNHYALLNFSDAIVGLVFSRRMQCILETRGGKHLSCQVLGSTFVSPYLIVLDLQQQEGAFVNSVVILPDSVDQEVLRQLRVLLRWKWKAVDSNSKL